MHCQLRSAERMLFDGEATMVVAHSPRGVFAVMDNHAPLLAVLDAGPLRIKTDEGERAFALVTGLLRVSPEGVMILAHKAVPAEEIDLSEVHKRLAEVKEEFAKDPARETLRLELMGLRVQERVGECHG